jgi:hypothetical protein
MLARAGPGSGESRTSFYDLPDIFPTVTVFALEYLCCFQSLADAAGFGGVLVGLVYLPG